MYDKDGKKLGVLAHEEKTHITNLNNSEMLSSLNKDLYSVKINDKFSNGDILSYKNPKQVTNKNNILSDSLDTAEHINKFTSSKNDGNEQDNFNISSLPNTTNTGLMD